MRIPAVYHMESASSVSCTTCWVITQKDSRLVKLNRLLIRRTASREAVMAAGSRSSHAHRLMDLVHFQTGSLLEPALFLFPKVQASFPLILLVVVLLCQLLLICSGQRFLGRCPLLLPASIGMKSADILAFELAPRCFFSFMASFMGDWYLPSLGGHQRGMTGVGSPSGQPVTRVGGGPPAALSQQLWGEGGGSASTSAYSTGPSNHKPLRKPISGGALCAPQPAEALAVRGCTSTRYVSPMRSLVLVGDLLPSSCCFYSAGPLFFMSLVASASPTSGCFMIEALGISL